MCHQAMLWLLLPFAPSRGIRETIKDDFSVLFEVQPSHRNVNTFFFFYLEQLQKGSGGAKSD